MSEHDEKLITLSSDPRYLAEAERLIKLNEHQPGKITCEDAICRGIECKYCPLTHLKDRQSTINGRVTHLKDRQSTINGRVTYRTLGIVRGIVDRIKQRQKQAGEEPDVAESTPTATSDVHQPSHYKLFQDVESIEVIARSMTVEQFYGFCFGNILKYRLRAGKKSELATMEKDLAKASFYETLFEQHKDKCHA